MKYWSTLAIWVILLWACGNGAPPAPGPAPASTDQQLAPVLDDAPARLRVDLPSYRLRDAPRADAATLDLLNRGTELTFTGETSPNAEVIALRGVRYNEPWLRVRTATGTEGWVYGGGVSPLRIGNSRTARAQLGRKLEGLFGRSVSQCILNYRDAFTRAATDAALAEAYTEGRALVNGPVNDYLVQELDYESLLAEDFRRPPALDWLSLALPGFTLGRVAEGTLYQLLEDDRQWLEKAIRTEGSADNGYFRVQTLLYPLDSVAYGYPSYFMQTWDYGGHSNLGSEAHLRILRAIDAAHSKGEPFRPALRELKAALIEDATTYKSYWQSAESARTELTTILAAGLDILTPEDEIALRTRLDQLRDPAANGLTVDQRNGGE